MAMNILLLKYKHIFLFSLFNSGSRQHKCWYRINHVPSQTRLMMTMESKPDKIPIAFTKSSCRTVKDMIDLLQHPFIYPLHSVDFMVDQNMVVVMYPVCKRGSLKDYIYQVSLAAYEEMPVLKQF